MDIANKAKQLISNYNQDLTTDNFIFRLHYVWTFRMLFFFVIFTSWSDLFEDRLKCLSHLHQDLMNTFCLVTPLKAGGPSLQWTRKPVPQNTITIFYYEWIPLVLGLQACSFYIGKAVWSITEDGDVAWLKELIERRQGWILPLKRLSPKWTSCLITAETINCLNLVVQVYLLDLFLGGDFLWLGVTWMKGDRVEAFPDRASCNLYKFGPSGGKQNIDALCFLPLNVFSKTMFLLIWFWYLSLGVLTVLNLITRVLNLIARPRCLICTPLCSNIFIQPKRSSMFRASVNLAPVSFTEWALICCVLKNLRPDTTLRALYELSQDYLQKECTVSTINATTSQSDDNPHANSLSVASTIAK